MKVEKCAAQLELIAEGDIIGAKNLGSDSPMEPDNEGSDGSHVSCSTVYSGPRADCTGHQSQAWTSVQFTEAMAVLNNFLKQPRSATCKNCHAKNPKINKPTFGWFHLVHQLITFGSRPG